MAVIIERVGDRYRAWSTVSDGYYHDPMSRDEIEVELRRWGWTLENIAHRLETAEVCEEWALSAEERDAEILGCKPEDVRYW